MIENIGYKPVIKQRKTNTGKAVGALVGVGTGAFTTVAFLASEPSYAQLVGDANQILERKPELLKNINPKEFINKYVKTERRQSIAKTGLLGIACIAAGLAIGTTVDAIINSKKAKHNEMK